MPRIGLITSSSSQHEILRKLIDSGDCAVSIEILLADLRKDISLLDHSGTDAWIIDIEADEPLYESGELVALDAWLASVDLPIIISEGNELVDEHGEPSQWARQLADKLHRVAGEITQYNKPANKPEAVWVLAASTGGPDAVVRFLKALPGDLGVNFIYAQHIDQFQHKTLVDTINRETQYHCSIPVHGDNLEANSVMVVPADYTIQFLASGSTVIDKTQQWRGDYKPSIDQVVANVANQFAERSGVIIFTGMGDDGALGSRLMSLLGGTIWIQTPDDCQSPSMPTACEQTGCVSFSGNPEALAENFANITHHQQWLSQLPAQPFADRSSI